MKLHSFSKINAPALLVSPAAMLHPARYTVLESHARTSLRTTRRAQLHKRCVAQASTGDSSTPQPVEDRRSGRTTYRPSSFTELVGDAVQAVVTGLEDGHMRMEVEFPAVSNVDGYKGASDLYIDSNIQLALAAAKQIAIDTGKSVHILLPDETEYRRAYKMFKSTLDLVDQVSLGHLQEGKQSMFSQFASLFTGGVNGSGMDGPIPDPANAAATADLFMALNASTIELPDFETYTNEKAQSKPMIAWNLELDTLRADLGLLGFPPKDLQYRFLSQFKPMFYIRQRDYSKTVAVSPFIINYSGCLFREYPGPWQVMLRQDNGVYACVAEDANRRYGLGEFKIELTRAMGLNTEPEGSAMAFLRSGYKTSTWWEDDEELEQHKDWRS